MKHMTRRRLAVTTLLVLWIACADEPSPDGELAVNEPAAEPEAIEASPADVWWEHVSSLCGQAFAGGLTSEDPTDAAFAEQSMTMHVRRCKEKRLEIPFHVGENRSRTWVLTRTDQGLRLQHDHRHENGSEDAISLYGGYADTSSSPATPGPETTLHFPADDFSKQLFAANGLSPSVANVWSTEILPGERFSYILTRPQRYFRADFDLTRAIEPPPAPWGHD